MVMIGCLYITRMIKNVCFIQLNHFAERQQDDNLKQSQYKL